MAGVVMHPVKSIAAVQVTYNDDGSEGMGLLTQIPRESTLLVCGEGFNERTVKVNLKGFRYFVFREDIEEFVGS
jgi:hypothetical protein